MRTICHLFAALLAILTLTGCQNEEQDQKETTDFSNLTIALKSPAISIDSRSVSLGDPDGNTDDMSEWNKYVDGRKLYRVTLFLINKKTNTIVGYRDSKDGSENGITIAENGKTATASFQYLHPKHGSIEILKHGEYRMVIVANYSNVSADNDSGTNMTYAGNAGVIGNIDNIKNSFLGETGLSTTNTNYQDLFNTKISTGNDYICPQQPQILTLVKDLQLKSGDNTVSAELVRTYSRMRLEVANHSNEQLKISNLSFSTNFAQKEAYIFDDPDNSNRKYSITDKGQPTVTSGNAIIPFNNSGVDIPHITHTESNQKAIFDAYILESKDENNKYTYTITAEFPNVKYTTYTLSSSSTTSLKNNGYYAIRNFSNNYFMKKGDTKVLCENISLDDVSSALNNGTDTYVWQLESAGETNSYYIKTVGKSVLYVDNATTSEVPLNANAKKTAYTISSPSNYSTIQSKSSSFLYLYSNGENLIGSNWYNNMVRWQFYEATHTESTAKKTTTLTLRPIHSTSGAVSDLTEIKRNDFIRGLVSVAYNPTTIDFNFEVLPWTTKDEDIEYN